MLPAAPRITAQVHKGGGCASSTAAAPVSASDLFGCSVLVRGLRQRATVGAWSSIFPRRALERIARAHISNARGSSNGPHCTARRAVMAQQMQYARPLQHHGAPVPFHPRARPPEAPGSATVGFAARRNHRGVRGRRSFFSDSARRHAWSRRRHADAFEPDRMVPFSSDLEQ